ncbi:MAG: hypothetical protein HZB53_14260 [Chloroflexi bacterium]|nr:hypothetical protein [Chloroflexota bacterium]
MINLLILVVPDDAKGEEIRERWRASGVKGVTILASAGMGHQEGKGARDDVPLLPSIRSLFAPDEVTHRTFFSVIDDDATLARALADAESVVGDFDAPDSGIMFVVPVSRAWGLHRR